MNVLRAILLASAAALSAAGAGDASPLPPACLGVAPEGAARESAPSIVAHGVTMEGDPELAGARAWGLQAIAAPAAWLHGQGNAAVVVAVVDSGIDADHEDLRDNLWRAPRDYSIEVGGRTLRCQSGDSGYDAIDDDCQPQERGQHGTNVSGIIGARGGNGKGIAGVSWRVTLLPVSFFDAEHPPTAARAAKALEFVRRLKESKLADVRVVNLSWGTHARSAAIESELVRLAALGVVIVASAGNEASDNDARPVFPAGYDSVSTLISVAATRSDGTLARSSNRGRASVDIAAPGISIRTTDPNDSYDSPFGTSMAAAMVTGSVALLASQCPALSGAGLRKLVLSSADRRAALTAHVAEGRFLNLRAAAEVCAEARGASAEARRVRLH